MKLVLIFLLISSVSFGQPMKALIPKKASAGGGPPAVISDGNTVAWYIADDLTTITKDGSNLVSAWNDKLGSGHDLVQATGTKQPLWSSNGILFDGVDDRLRTATFTYNQPAFVYIVMKQVTHVDYEYIISSFDDFSVKLIQGDVGARIDAYAGAPLTNTNLALDTWGIVRILFNGASSKLMVNTNSTAGSLGTNAMAGITLGAAGGTSGSDWSNIQVKEAVFRKVADNSTDEGIIYDYLKAKYGL